MVKMMDLEQMERKTWSHQHQDGLRDIYLGLILGAVGVSGMVQRSDVPSYWGLVVYLALAAVFYGSYRLGTRLITRPRLGEVKVGPKGKARQRSMIAVSIIAVALTVALVVATVGLQGQGFRGDPEAVARTHIAAPLITVLILVVVFGLTAFLTNFPRMILIGIGYAVGVGAVLLYIIAEMDAMIIATFGAAAAITLMGGIVFSRFLRDHPIPEME